MITRDKHIFIIILVLLLQILLATLIILTYIGLESILLLRQVVGFIYLTFVPGYLIIKLIKVSNKLEKFEILIYIVGLSVSFLMFIGLVINFLYPYLGIEKPFSELSLAGTFLPITLTLGCYVLFKDKNKDKDKYFPVLNLNLVINKVLSIHTLCLLLIPFLAIFGTFLLNYYDNNIILLILIFIISIFPILVAFDKIPKNAYPLMIWSLSLSLLFHTTLFSTNLTGHDLHLEFYYAHLVIEKGYWDFTIKHNMNSILSITMIMPIFSIICGINPVWVIKIFYPILFSFVPLGIFYITKKQSNSKIAFFSSFYFMALYQYYLLMATILRQQIALLFLTLIVLLIIDNNINGVRKALLLVLFTISLVTSHYGTTYMFMLLVIGILIYKVLNNIYSYNKKNFYNNKFPSINYFTLYIVSVLGWYLFVTSSSGFETIIDFGNHMIHSMFVFEEKKSPQYSGMLYHLLVNAPISVQFIKLINSITFIFIVFGILDIIFNSDIINKFNFNKIYLNFAIITFIFILMTEALPHFTYAQIGIGRLYLVSLLFLGPFCVIGWIKILRIIKKDVIYSWQKTFKILSVFFMVFLLFNSGFISNLCGDYVWSPYITKKQVVNSYKDRKDEVNRYFMNYIPEQDFDGAKWLSKYRGTLIKIFGDKVAVFTVLYSNVGPPQKEMCYILTNKTKIGANSYIYLRYVNTVHNILSLEYGKSREWINTTIIIKKLEQKKFNKIYDNDGCVIYYL